MVRKPRTKGETRTIDAMRDVLEDEEWVSRQKLAEKIDEHSEHVSEETAKANLSTYRKYIEKQGFQTKDEPEGAGNPTVYWRLEQ